MKIGIDLTTIQGPHRYRGVGATQISFINNLTNEIKKSVNFVFFAYPEVENSSSYLDLLNLSDMNYEIRVIGDKNMFDQETGIPVGFFEPRPEPRVKALFRTVIRTLKTTVESAFGDFRKLDVSDLDYYLQFEQNKPLPSGVKTLLVLYDLIPFVLKSEYLQNYKSARLSGFSILLSAIKHMSRKKHMLILRLNARRAYRLVAISEQTKADFERIIKPRKNIDVVPLGVSEAGQNIQKPEHRYLSTSWGPVKIYNQSIDKKFLFYVGGADSRRKLTDLFAAYYNLKARGEDICLVLAGDTMKGFEQDDFPDELKNYFSDSYRDDIYFLGFVKDSERNWLYANSLAFVFPSLYEGFGLPVLESMKMGSPTIAYGDLAIKEVAGNNVLYAENWKDIVNNVLYILNSKQDIAEMTSTAMKAAKKYSWQSTVEGFFSLIS